MPFFTVLLKDIPVAVIMAEDLEEAIEAACHTGRAEMMYELTLDGIDLWDDDIEPALRPATMDEIGAWALEIDDVLMEGDIEPEQIPLWLAIIHEDS
jgi:hypothetical protein